MRQSTRRPSSGAVKNSRSPSATINCSNGLRTSQRNRPGRANANSPLVDGRDSGFQSYRAHCWLSTDDDRCGLLPFAFAPGFYKNLAYDPTTDFSAVTLIADVPFILTVNPTLGTATLKDFIAMARETDFARHGTGLWTRVNALNSPWLLDDLIEVVGEVGDKLDVVMVPKVEVPWDIHYVDQLLAQLEAVEPESIPKDRSEDPLSAVGLATFDALRREGVTGFDVDIASARRPWASSKR